MYNGMTCKLRCPSSPTITLHRPSIPVNRSDITYRTISVVDKRVLARFGIELFLCHMDVAIDTVTKAFVCSILV